MAHDIFIKIQGIAGESQDAIHRNEIDVIDWTWKVVQQSLMMSGSGGGASKATVSDFEFTHLIDKASPNLASYCFTGKHIPEVRLVMRKSVGNDNVIHRRHRERWTLVRENEKRIHCSKCYWRPTRDGNCDHGYQTKRCSLRRTCYEQQLISVS
ncbi:hypothetical protein BN2476_810025 [Paraburkholderia piptadeniae]|uniref:Hcp1 family type VI secretion system effector n=1 Tax=Paraburkholderia piptadeniae TaxID=1701573 RepID=A0A1N7SST7_9BURK|nr:hypothetical protein BN2476_810025 [Paraburkholderia piptadeniae]